MAFNFNTDYNLSKLTCQQKSRPLEAIGNPLRPALPRPACICLDTHMLRGVSLRAHFAG